MLIKNKNQNQTPGFLSQPQCGPCRLCEFLHLSYQDQLQVKQKKFISLLKDLGAQIAPPIPSPEKSHFRNKLQMALKKNGAKLSMGFYKPGTHFIIDFKDCYIQDRRLNKAARAIKNVLEKFPLNIYDEKKHKGLLRYLFLRSSSSTDAIQLCLVATSPIYPGIKKVKDAIRSEFKRRGLRLSGFILNINDRNTNVILGDKEKIILGTAKLSEKILGGDFQVSVGSFLQTNPGVAGKMIQRTLELLGLEGNETGWDLYCGIGAIGLALAKRVHWVTGFDSQESSIVDAKANAKLNRIQNIDFIRRDLDSEFPRRLENPDFVVMDPARQGCSERLINLLAMKKIRKLVYISCNPNSLERDLRLLKKGGYRIKTIQLVDMFPFTGHMESITLLEYPKIKIN